MYHQEKTSTTSATSATSAQSAQSPESPESLESDSSSGELSFVLAVCGHYISSDGHCKHDGCDGGGFLPFEQVEKMFEKNPKSKSKTQTRRRSDSSSNPHVGCEAGSSSIQRFHCEDGPAGSSSIQRFHCEDGPSDFSSNPLVCCEAGQSDSLEFHVDSSSHSERKCLMCSGKCPGNTNDAFSSTEFCSISCFNYSRNRNSKPVSISIQPQLPEGAFWDRCQCGKEFPCGLTDNIDANYCSWHCYSNR